MEGADGRMGCLVVGSSGVARLGIWPQEEEEALDV